MLKDSRMIFGFCLLLLLTVLAMVIALGHVEERTSFGLQQILGALGVLCGGFAQWAFSHKPTDNPPPASLVDTRNSGDKL